jgi:hypothetical protein
MMYTFMIMVAMAAGAYSYRATTLSEHAHDLGEHARLDMVEADAMLSQEDQESAECAAISAAACAKHYEYFLWGEAVR